MIKLGKDEKILKVVRKHWFVLFSDSIFLLAFILIPIFAWIGFVIVDIPFSVDFGGSGIALVVCFTCLWMLFIWITFFIIWTDYYLDILIVTNNQIFDIIVS